MLARLNALKRFKTFLNLLRFFWAGEYPEDLLTNRRDDFIKRIKAKNQETQETQETQEGENNERVN